MKSCARTDGLSPFWIPHLFSKRQFRGEFFLCAASSAQKLPKIDCLRQGVSAMEAVPDRILRNLPQELQFKESSMFPEHTGVWAKRTIKKGTVFGPFEGQKKKLQDVDDDTYSWEIRGPKGRRLYCIDAADPNTGNWMRYVKSARYFEEQNILASQEKKNIFYKAMRDIPSGKELLCWFSTGHVAKVSPRKEDTSGNETSEAHDDEAEPETESEAGRDSISPGHNPLAIALGGIQISNVVSLASPENVPELTTDHSNESTEGTNRMPVLEKINSDVARDDQSADTCPSPIQMQVSPTHRSSCASPPLISPMFGNNIGDVQGANGTTKTIEHGHNLSKQSVGEDSCLVENVSLATDAVEDVESSSSSLDKQSASLLQTKGTDDQTLQEGGDKIEFENQGEVAESVEFLSIPNTITKDLSHESAEFLSIPNTVTKDLSHESAEFLSIPNTVTKDLCHESAEFLSIPNAVTKDLSHEPAGGIKSTGCTLRNPKYILKKVDFLCTTKYKKNVVKCLTCGQIFQTVSQLRSHFVNSTGPPFRRRRRAKRGSKKLLNQITKRKIKPLINGQTSANSNKEDVLVDKGMEAPGIIQKTKLDSLPPVDLDPKTSNLEEKIGQQKTQVTSPPKLAFACEFCELTFDCFKSLDDHVKAHYLGQLPYKCKYCKAETDSLPSIHAHVISHQMNADFPSDDNNMAGVGRVYQARIAGHGIEETIVKSQSKSSKDIPKNPTTYSTRRHFQNLLLKTHAMDQPSEVGGSYAIPLESSQAKFNKIKEKKRFINKIYPCNLCNKMFASLPNVYRHKRVVHGVSVARMRKRRTKLLVNLGETSPYSSNAKLNTSMSGDQRAPVPAPQFSSDVSSTHGTVSTSRLRQVSPNVSVTNMQPPTKLYVVSGKRVRPILPAPTTAVSNDSPLVSNQSAVFHTHPPTSSQQNVTPITVPTFSYTSDTTNDVRKSQIAKQPSSCTPSASPPVTINSGAHIDVKSLLLVPEDQTQSTLQPPSARKSTHNCVDNEGVILSNQTKEGFHQGSKIRQFSVVSPQYANTVTDQTRLYQRAQLSPRLSSSFSRRSPNEGTLASLPQRSFPKEEPQSSAPFPYAARGDPNGEFEKPRPYIPTKGIKVTSRSSSIGNFDKFGAMDLATKRSYVQSGDSDSALDLSLPKRLRLDNTGTEPLPYFNQLPEQTVPLDLSKKAKSILTTMSSTVSDCQSTSIMSTQLQRTLEVVNAQAALQVKSRNSDLSKLYRTSGSPTFYPIKTEIKPSNLCGTGTKSSSLDSSQKQVFSPPNFTVTPVSQDNKQCLFQVSSPGQSSIASSVTHSKAQDQDGLSCESSRHSDVIQNTAVDSSLQKATLQDVSGRALVPTKMDFACNVCGEVLPSMTSMNAHVIEHAKDWPYKCEFCLWLFQNPSGLAVHRTQHHHVKKMYSCGVCRRDFAYLSNLQKHQVDSHGLKEYTYRETNTGELRPLNFTDPRQGVVHARPLASIRSQQSPRVSFIAQEMSKLNPLKIGKLTIPVKSSSFGVAPVKSKTPPRKHVPFNPQRHHPFAHARQIGYLSMLADPKNQEQLSGTLVNRCTKCEKEFDSIADFHKHIMECAAKQETSQPGAQIVERSQDVRIPGALSASQAATEGDWKLNNSKEEPQVDEQSKPGSTDRPKRAKPGLKIYNPMKYSRREPAGNMDDIHTCHGCEKKFYFINKLERHMRMCPNRDKLKLNQIMQVKLMTKKKDQTLLNYQHQCPFCKHHYTYLKSLKKHVLVCQFRPADVVDPLKYIEENAMKKETSVSGNDTQDEETPKSTNNESSITASMETTRKDTSELDDVNKKTAEESGMTDRQETSENSAAGGLYDRIGKHLGPQVAASNEDEFPSMDNDQQPPTASSFQLRIRPMSVGPIFSKKGKKKTRCMATWNLASVTGKTQSTQLKQSEADNSSLPTLKKYPIRERSPAVSSCGELSNVPTYLGRPRGRKRGRARKRGNPLSHILDASPPKVARRGRRRGRGRPRGGRLYRGLNRQEMSAPAGLKKLGSVIEDVPNRASVTVERRGSSRLQTSGRGRRGRSCRGRGLVRGRGRGRGRGRVSMQGAYSRGRERSSLKPRSVHEAVNEEGEMPEVSNIANSGDKLPQKPPINQSKFEVGQCEDWSDGKMVKQDVITSGDIGSQGICPVETSEGIEENSNLKRKSGPKNGIDATLVSSEPTKGLNSPRTPKLQGSDIIVGKDSMVADKLVVESDPISAFMKKVDDVAHDVTGIQLRGDAQGEEDGTGPIRTVQLQESDANTTLTLVVALRGSPL
ncbi:PR domain zinc finger protein 2-like isoform X2 [Acanthaster planci]|uniref:PR domain zinc finger protein 2-like isoform X2 n=1 Tax=Acanthaster planci TaxID=133434 RepID=A0A8B7YCC4_ACAPL|nr:PR domain zinc finger protein 2-like isoform X2 [Acanthaster planci]